MNRLSILPILIALGCDPSSLKNAIPELDLPPEAKAAACEVYKQGGMRLAQKIFEQDLPVFDPIWASPPDPVADEAFCREVVTSRGGTFIYKPDGAHSSTALFLVVALHPKYDSWSPERRVSICLHEAGHIVGQHNRKQMAVADYLLWRLTEEGIWYALTARLLARHGASPESIERGQRRRARSFPDVYYMGNTLEPECVAEYFAELYAELGRRTGVQ
jgi:hypothetical protein